MNEIVNKCLLTGDKFMPEMQLKQPGFTYSAFGLFTKNKKIVKFMQTGDTNYIYRNDLDKTWYKDLKISGLDINIWLKEQNQMKVWKIMPLKLQVIQNMMDMKMN